MTDDVEYLPRLTELRYSTNHDGWFWIVEAKNPNPMIMPDGKPSSMDQTLFRSGYARTHKRAYRKAQNARAELNRLISRALKEMEHKQIRRHGR